MKLYRGKSTIRNSNVEELFFFFFFTMQASLKRKWVRKLNEVGMPNQVVLNKCVSVSLAFYLFVPVLCCLC